MIFSYTSTKWTTVNNLVHCSLSYMKCVYKQETYKSSVAQYSWTSNYAFKFSDVRSPYYSRSTSDLDFF